MFPSPASTDLAGDLRVEPVHVGGDPLLHLCDVLLERKAVGMRAIEGAPAEGVSLHGVAERARVLVQAVEQTSKPLIRPEAGGIPAATNQGTFSPCHYQGLSLAGLVPPCIAG